MKRIKNILAILAICGFAAGCHVSDLDQIVPSKTGEGEDIPFVLSFDQTDPSATRSMVSGEEVAINGVGIMQLLCFDASGLYLGMREATIWNGEGPTAEPAKGQTGRFSGVVPAGTARIHFVANRNLANPLSFTAGTSERVVMRSEELSTIFKEKNGTKNKVCYWGYHAEESTEAMKEWLLVGVEVDNNGNAKLDEETGLPKVLDGQTPHKVYLIRDRARVKLDVTKLTTNSTSWTSGWTVQWLIHNGRDRGYVAPYDATQSNPWIHMDYASKPAATSLPLSEYTTSGRYTLYTDESNNEDNNFDASSAIQYVFDDVNDKISETDDSRLKIILKLTKSGEQTKYYVVLLKNSESQQIKVIRNNTYVIAVNSLPQYSGFYKTLKEACDGSPFADIAADVDRTIPVVSDEEYALQVMPDPNDDSKTAIVYGETGGKDIPFKFMKASDMSVINNASPSDFTLSWESGDVAAYTPANGNFTAANLNFDGTLWHIKIDINALPQDNNPFDDYLVIKHKSGLVRYVHVYAIEAFHYPSGGAPVFKKESNNGFTEGGKNYAVYSLTFTIPENYKSDLYPINVRFATSTLDAYSDDEMTTRHGTFGAIVASTADLTNSDTATAWNYHASTWDYWYEYSIPNREATDNGKVTIYLKDATGSKTQTNPSSVGLFLRIPFFGATRSANMAKNAAVNTSVDLTEL